MFILVAKFLQLFNMKLTARRSSPPGVLKILIKTLLWALLAIRSAHCTGPPQYTPTGYACPGQDEYFFGLIESAAHTITHIDASQVTGDLVAGGYTTNPSVFPTSPVKAQADQAVVILFFQANETLTPTKALMLSTYDFTDKKSQQMSSSGLDQSVQTATGLLALKISDASWPSNQRIYGLFNTDGRPFFFKISTLTWDKIVIEFDNVISTLPSHTVTMMSKTRQGSMTALHNPAKNVMRIITQYYQGSLNRMILKADRLGSNELSGVGGTQYSELIAVVTNGLCDHDPIDDTSSEATASAGLYVVIAATAYNTHTASGFGLCILDDNIPAGSTAVTGIGMTEFAIVYLSDSSGKLSDIHVIGIKVIDTERKEFTTNQVSISATETVWAGIKAVSHGTDTQVSIVLKDTENRAYNFHQLDALSTTDSSYALRKISAQVPEIQAYDLNAYSQHELFASVKGGGFLTTWGSEALMRITSAQLRNKHGIVAQNMETEGMFVVQDPPPEAQIMQSSLNLVRQWVTKDAWDFDMGEYNMDTSSSELQSLMVRNPLKLSFTNKNKPYVAHDMNSNDASFFYDESITLEKCFDGTNPLQSYSFDQLFTCEIVSVTGPDGADFPNWPSFIQESAQHPPSILTDQLIKEEGTTLPLTYESQEVKVSSELLEDRDALPLGNYTITYRLWMPAVENRGDFNSLQTHTSIIELSYCFPSFDRTKFQVDETQVHKHIYREREEAVLEGPMVTNDQNCSILDTQLYIVEQVTNSRNQVPWTGWLHGFAAQRHEGFKFSIKVAADFPASSGGMTDFVYVLTETETGRVYEELAFGISVTLPCQGSFTVPEASEKAYDYVYLVGSGLLEISFQGIGYGGCTYGLELRSESESLEFKTGVLDGNEAIAEAGTYAITLVQPVLSSEGSGGEISGGSLKVVFAEDYGSLGDLNLQLRVKGIRYDDDTTKVDVPLTLTIIKCVGLSEDSEEGVESEPLRYSVGSAAYEIPFASKNGECDQTEVTLTDELGRPLDDSIFQGSFDAVTRRGSIIVQTEDSEYAGQEFTVRVVETDPFLNFTAVQVIRVSVTAEDSRDAVQKYLIDESGNDQTAAIDITQEESFKQDGPDQPDSDADNSEAAQSETQQTNTPIEALIERDENGNIFFPWQPRPEQKKKSVVGEFTIEPLQAQVQDVSATGHFSITFNKPIIIPPFAVRRGRRLQTAIDISQVLEISIEQPYVDSDQSQSVPSVASMLITELTKTRMDIQLKISNTEKISKSPMAADQLTIRFRWGKVFMDREHQTQLANDFFIRIPLVPQLSPEEISTLTVISEGIESSLDTISIAVLTLQVFLAFGLKYLFGIMNLLQFLIYMQSWQILLSTVTAIFLKQLKSLAFLEFIPTEQLKDWIKDLLGVCTKDGAACRSENEHSDIAETFGASRLGSSSLVDNMGAMLLIAAALVLVIILLLACRALVKCSTRIKQFYEKVKRKIFWNSIIRYILQSSLKMQVAACTIVFFHATGRKAIGSGQLSIAAGTVALFWQAPIVFLAILLRNRKHLELPSITAKIGTLYTGMNPQKPKVVLYSVLFLLRRCAFSITMFLLFNHPALQASITLELSSLHILFLLSADFFGSSLHRRVEVANESIFLAVQCLFLAATNLALPAKPRANLGTLIVALTSVLLAANMALIVWTSVTKCRRKLRLQKARRENMEQTRKQREFKQESRAEAEKFRKEFQANRQQMLDLFYKGDGIFGKTGSKRKESVEKESEALSGRDGRLISLKRESSLRLMAGLPPVDEQEDWDEHVKVPQKLKNANRRVPGNEKNEVMLEVKAKAVLRDSFDSILDDLSPPRAQTDRLSSVKKHSQTRALNRN